MSFVTTIQSPQGDTYAAVAFLSDEALVISLDPEYDSYAEDWQRVFDNRINQFADFISQSQDPAEGVLGACLYNNMLLTGNFEHYDNDDDAVTAVHRLEGIPS